jgi:DNA (cytosine-5)-methyltransferase 1
MTYNVLSLYSGAGGLDLGFELSGEFETNYAIEFDPVYSQTMPLNSRKLVGDREIFPNTQMINDSVENLLDSKFFDDLENIDGVIGGPPCQPFSTMGKRRGLLDERSRSIFDYFEVVSRVRPKFFLFENVPNIQSQWDGSVVEQLENKIQEIGGYKLTRQIIDFSTYGAATFRRRFIMVGIKDSLKLPDDLLDGHEEFITVSQVLAGLPKAHKTRVEYPTDHVKVNHTNEVLERFAKLKPGEHCKVRKRWRLNGDRPSNSLMAGGSGGYVLHIHPYENRELTLREAARIQGFPDCYEFSGRKLDVAKQIVNAVPVQAAKILAKKLSLVLKGAR